MIIKYFMCMVFCCSMHSIADTIIIEILLLTLSVVILLLCSVLVLHSMAIVAWKRSAHVHYSEREARFPLGVPLN